MNGSRNLERYITIIGELPDDRDIRDVCGRELPKADLLVGGFPCATFSVAGRQTGMSLEDTRGTLCFEMFRIVQQRRTLICSLRMLKDSYLTTMEEVLESSSSPWMRWGMTANGKCLTLQTLESHNTEKESSLLDILEENPDPNISYRKKGEKDTRRSAEGVRPLLTPDRVNKRQRGRRVKNDGDPAFTIGVQDRHGILLEDKDFNYGSKRLNETLAKVEIGADEIKHWMFIISKRKIFALF